SRPTRAGRGTRRYADRRGRSAGTDSGRGRSAPSRRSGSVRGAHDPAAVLAGGLLENALRVFAPRQRDDAAAETRAGQARTQRARVLERSHERVELGRRDLIVVAQARWV